MTRIRQKHVALYVTLDRDTEHTRTDVKTNPFVTHFSQDFARKT